MDSRLKQRLVGALVLVIAAVIFVPMIFGPADEERTAPAAAPARESLAVPAQGAVVEPIAPPGSEPARDDEPLAGNVAPTEVATVREPAPPDGDASAAGTQSAYAVQLASFSDARNAKALERRLADKGYAAFTTAGEGGSPSLTRVYVGPLGKLAEAKDMRERLRRETDLEGLVVRYPDR